MSKSICIILSSYNGSKYISEQIQSIISQTYSNWLLYIRDDGSTDSTCKIIQEFAEKDSRIHLIENNENVGVKRSFFKLLNMVNGDYYMFCDQDDVWDKNKIEIMLKAIEDIDDNIPTVISCDLRLINEKNEIIHESMRKSHHIDNLSHKSWGLIVAPMFPGCSMIFNNAAKLIALNEKYEFPLHDMQLTYSVFKNGGKVLSIDNTLMSYRQHANNVVGAVIGKNYLIEKFQKLNVVLKKNKQHFSLVNHYLNVTLLKYIYLKIKHAFFD